MVGQHVLIADDHPLTREGLALATRAAFPGIAIDTAGSIAEAQTAIALRRARYRLVLLDIVLPDARGLSGFLQLQRDLDAIPLVIVSAFEDAVVVEAARVLGAAGYLSKSLSLDKMAAALRAIADGSAIFPSAAAAVHSTILSMRDRIATLSGAQLKVLLALADGRLNKQIAGDLDISEATVKAHFTAIFRKLGVNNRAQALLAMQPFLHDTANA